MRFDYDPPAPFLLVAGHGVVLFRDRKLDQTSQFPVSETPLGMLLADHARLSGDVTVTGIDRQPGMLQVTLVRTGHAADGSLTLVFEDNPLQLRQWSVIDAQRMETRVSLFNVELGGKFDQKLFDVSDPARLQGGNQGR
jgi:outer membrane lipoprotein-sorting protein